MRLAEKRTDHLQVDMARDACLDREPGGEVPAAEVERRADDEVGNFGHDLRADEGDPMVCFGLSDRISLFLEHGT